MNSELLRKYQAEINKHAGSYIEWQIAIPHLVILIAQVQLALRHPGNNGASAVIAQQLVDEMITMLESGGMKVAASVAKSGNDPKNDVWPEVH